VGFKASPTVTIETAFLDRVAACPNSVLGRELGVLPHIVLIHL
jgi:hypothetical protein